MFDILSTAELTVSSAIVVVFLSLAMARTAGGRASILIALAAWFVLVLALGATGALSPGGGGAPALGLTVALSIGALVWAYFALPSVRNAMTTTPLPALIAPPCDPPARIHLHRALRRWPPSRAVRAKRGMGGCVHGRNGAAARLGGYAVRRPRATAGLVMERARGRRPRRRSHARALVGARSASGFRRTPGQLANDHFALAHHSRLSRSDPVFHSHRHLHSAACQVPGLRAGACVARRWRPAEVGLKRRRRA